MLGGKKGQPAAHSAGGGETAGGAEAEPARHALGGAGDVYGSRGLVHLVSVFRTTWRSRRREVEAQKEEIEHPPGTEVRYLLYTKDTAAAISSIQKRS